MTCATKTDGHLLLTTLVNPHPSALAVAITIAAEVPKAVPPPPDEFVVAWPEQYFTLLPGEHRTLRAEVVGAFAGSLRVSGWNVVEATYACAASPATAATV